MESHNENFELLPKRNEKNRALAFLKKLMLEFASKKRTEDVENLQEVMRLLQEKRYGIVWEEHAEDVDVQMKTSIPIFAEDRSKQLKSDSKSDDFNFLIEGDNLHTLHLMQRTHWGKIDFIYIDPPYNTGSKSFKYNDEFVSSDDAYFHSKWLSFMNRRMKLAKNLLAPDGVLFISIDNNEYANLKLLMDEIMPSGYVTTIHVQMSATQGMKVGSAKNGSIVKNGEYILVYSRSGNKQIIKHPLTNRTDYDGHYNKYLKPAGRNTYTEEKLADVLSAHDDIVNELKLLGLVASNRKLSNSNISAYYEKSKKARNYINEHADLVVRDHTSGNNIENPDQYKIGLVYKYNSKTRSYLIQKNKQNKFSQKIQFADKLGWSDDFKPKFGPLTIRGDWWKDFYLDMGNVSKEGGVKLDNGKKPLRLIKQLIKATTTDNALIFDFFAGSGTTGHAVNELNAESETSNRHFIMATSDEVVDTAYKRMENISKTNGINLKYLKTQFIPANSTNLEFELLKNIKTMVELEYRIDQDNPSIAFVFRREDLKCLNLTILKTIYVRTRVHDLMSNDELLNIQDNSITLVDIPDKYFANELRGTV